MGPDGYHLFSCSIYFLLEQLILVQYHIFLNNYYFQHIIVMLVSFCIFYCCYIKHTCVPPKINKVSIWPQEGLAPINLIVENELHRATPGGTGGVKTIGNYAAVSQTASLFPLLFVTTVTCSYMFSLSDFVRCIRLWSFFFLYFPIYKRITLCALHALGIQPMPLLFF